MAKNSLFQELDFSDNGHIWVILQIGPLSLLEILKNPENYVSYVKIMMWAGVDLIRYFESWIVL